MCHNGGGSVNITCHSYTCRRGDPYSVEDYNKTEYEDVTPSCN